MKHKLKLLLLPLALLALLALSACASGGTDQSDPSNSIGTVASVSTESRSDQQADTQPTQEESASFDYPAYKDSAIADEPTQEETVPSDYPHTVMVKGVLYQDTGRESTADGRCGNMDGEITSSVDQDELPSEDNQSNFGCIGTGYQYGFSNGTIELYLNDTWYVFEQVDG